MSNKLVEYQPHIYLQKYIDAYWSFRNTTKNKINFPVVPDGCSDIIFYLNDSKKLGNLQDTFVTGVMENAQLIPIPNRMELFGIRFNPGILSYFLETNMSKLTNNMMELFQINSYISDKIKINPYDEDKNIISKIEPQLKDLLKKIKIENNVINVIKEITKNPQILIEKITKKYKFSLKSLQRIFQKRLGLTPKKFSRIMRFQKAHRKISKDGLKNLIIIALRSGYFDQAHFNREYQKLVGCNPSNETMSILYNKSEEK